MSEWAEQPAVPAAGATPGAILAAQRQAMGWTVEQVAEQLKLAVRQVVALETGDYDALPGPAVVRGFIRAYAKVVKTDAAPLVAMVPLAAPEAGDATQTTVRREKPATFSEVRFPTHGRKTGLPYGAIALALLLAAGAGLAWHFQLLPQQLLYGQGAPASATAVAAPTGMTVLQPPLSPSALPAPVAAPATRADEVPPPAATVPLISVPPQQAAQPAATPVPGAPPMPASGNALVLNVTADSWIEVRSGKGRPLLSRLVRAGQTETLDINEPVSLVVGKPGGVKATLRGAPLELPPSPGSTISRITIK